MPVPQQPERRGPGQRSRHWILQTSALLASGAAVACTADIVRDQNLASRPFPSPTTYAPGIIRPDHIRLTVQDDVIRAAYDRWASRYIVGAGTGAAGRALYRVALGRPGMANHAVTVWEGQGYGLVITAYLAGHDPNARPVFDGLWRFARGNPSAREPRLMTWHVPPDTDSGQVSAFAGDSDIAYGLLLADDQ